MLLEAEDFLNEQSYHRGRLAEVLARLHGCGTVAGLRVVHLGPESAPQEELRVLPGVAVDARGRLLELTTMQCLRVKEWFDFAVTSRDGVALPVPFSEPGSRWLLADVFLTYNERPAGLRPAFPEAAVDALDAVVPHRLVEGARVLIVPLQAGAAEPALPTGSPKLDDRAAVEKAILDADLTGFSQRAPTAPPDAPDALLLARIRVKLKGTSGFVRADDGVLKAENHVRQFLPSASNIFATIKLKKS
jgi:hypothetical protein